MIIKNSHLQNAEPTVLNTDLDLSLKLKNHITNKLTFHTVLCTLSIKKKKYFFI